jgi:hypothetical protein
MKKKSSAPVVLVTLLLFTMLGTLAATSKHFSLKKLNIFEKGRPVATFIPSFAPSVYVPKVQPLPSDIPINPTELAITPEGRFKYHFTLGEPHQAEADFTNNYTIEFPTSWKSFTNTNDRYGTNLILKKESSTITVDQQLYEGGVCIFLQEGEQQRDAGVPCTLVENITIGGESYKIFYYRDRVEQYNQKRYGLCKVVDSLYCSPWAKFGEVQYVTVSDTTEDYQEFKSVVKSIVVD